MTTAKKSKPLFLALLASCSILLAGCDDFEALPRDEVYDAPILNLGESDLTQNAMSKIYDALVNAGDANSQRVLENILYIYSESLFGAFFDHDEVEGLLTTVESGDDAKIKAFAEKYPAYGGDSSKVVQFYRDVLYRIRSTFFGYVNDANYQERSQFVEKKFYDAQTANYYDLAQIEEANGTTVYPYNRGAKQIDGTFVLTEDIVETGSLVLDGKDNSATGDIDTAYFKDIFGTYASYIESAILPNIYRNELTVNYLKEVNRSTLELSAARKVRYIALDENTNEPGSTADLMRAYANIVIEGDAYDSNVYGFEFLDTLYKGYDYFTWDAAEERHVLATAIYKAAGWGNSGDPVPAPVGSETVYYYPESGYGSIMRDYVKLTNNRFDDDTTVRNDFTNNGAYTVETGLAIKVNALLAQDHTTNGWFANSSAMDDSYPLTSTLFDTRVANEVDSVDYVNGAYVDANLDYGMYRDGNYYLLPENSDEASSTRYIYLSDSTYYMTIVDEAVKRAKVNSNYEDQYYGNLAKHAADEESFADEVLHKIGYNLSSSDTWTNAARNYYVERMAAVFHDTYVYDYFVATFPDIFD